ncbi:MAG TPA: FoF1 ATP synthase subunit gamma [Patescibacteria group bacterium]|nr:FoF1 ATP synthase subunit gamma [Patescibacteria group bacterium]
MPTIADLKLQLDDAITLSLISSAFTEASAAGLQKIKKQFEINQQFYDEISHVYHLVRASGERLQLDKKITPLEKKIVSVAMTSNQRFYGNLNVNVMRGYLEEIEKQKTDVMVIGLTGSDFMKSSGFVKPYSTMMFEKDSPTTQEVQKFLDATVQYDSILVYFPKFVSLVTQTVGVIDITQTISPTDQTPEEEIHILFEPEYSKILEFFKRQVRNLLLMRVLLEASLSRTSARLITMSSAEERADALIKETKGQLRKIQLSIANTRLLETFAGIGKWKKKKKKKYEEELLTN